MRLRRRGLRYFGFSAFLARLSATLFIVFSTYNPSGVSYYHWLAERWPADWLLQVPVAMAYVIAYFHLTRSTFRALNTTGIALAITFMGSIVWVLTDLGVIELATPGDLGLISLYMFAGVLGVGVSWMWVYTLVTGQANIDNLTQ